VNSNLTGNVGLALVLGVLLVCAYLVLVTIWTGAQQRAERQRRERRYTDAIAWIVARPGCKHHVVYKNMQERYEFMLAWDQAVKPDGMIVDLLSVARASTGWCDRRPDSTLLTLSPITSREVAIQLKCRLRGVRAQYRVLCG
jgi:predicted outer membrane lipoprotein